MDFVIGGAYAVYFATLAVFLWIYARPWLSARGHYQAEWWVTNIAIAAAIIVPIQIQETVAGKEQSDFALAAISPVMLALIVHLFRNVYYWAKEKAGFGGNGGGHIRGAALADEKTVAKQLKHAKSRFSVGAVPVPVELETRGFLLAGSPGTGKSQTLTHALDALRADGATAVIADASGIYTSRYFSAGGKGYADAILNPFDERCVKWSPLCELESQADIPALAKSLVPDGEGPAAEWNSYAQTFVEAVLEHCFTAGLGNGELFRILVVADLEELREVCAGTPAQPLVADGNERMFGSIRGIASSSAKFLQYLDPNTDATNGFSIRRYLHNDNPGYLFLSYQQQHRDALKHMISCAVDVASRAVLSLPPSHDRRVIFALDELPLLGKIQSIVDLATNGRKHGAMIFAGLQTVSQLRELYGQETSQTLLACLGSWLVLRVSDAATAEYMSRYLGEEEKTRIVKSGGESGSFTQGSSTSENWQQQVVKDRVVLPSELQQMPDLRGIFNLAGPVPAAVVNLRIAAAHQEAEAFVAAAPRVRTKPQVKKVEDASPAGNKDRDAGAQPEAYDLL